MTDKFRMFWNDPEHCLKIISLIKDEDDILYICLDLGQARRCGRRGKTGVSALNTKKQTNENNNIKERNKKKILTTVIPLSNQGAMAKASGADPQWLSAPHSQIMVSQAGWP